MPEVTLSLAVSSFVAGFLMFLAPCTLPLIPAYIAFISGVSEADAKATAGVRSTLLRNAIAFVCGFSFVFISLGLVVGYAGSFIGAYKPIVSQFGGILIVFFGLMMLNVLSFPFFKNLKRFSIPKAITPGNAHSAFIIGSIFALGWTPCIGPILASVLLFASLSATALYGALLLLLFSIGLAIPFILTALLFARIADAIVHYKSVLYWVNVIGALFLILIGILLLTNNFAMTLQYGTTLFEILHIEGLLGFY